jgi:hypothetical protein
MIKAFLIGIILTGSGQPFVEQGSREFSTWDECMTHAHNSPTTEREVLAWYDSVIGWCVETDKNEKIIRAERIILK